MLSQKNNIILMTAVTLDYIKKSKNYFQSINRYSECKKNILIVVWDFGKKSLALRHLFALLLTGTLGKMGIRFLFHGGVTQKSKIHCIQHGEFIKVLNKEEMAGDPVVVFTDADMRMQRPLLQVEMDFLGKLESGDFYVGINEHREESLEDEAIKIGGAPTFVVQHRSKMENKKIFNTGVYAARTTTIRKLLEIYNHEHQFWAKNFSHYACQQWIISYVIQSNSIFRVLEMPTSFHSHCHRLSLLPNAGSYMDQLGILRSEQSDLPVLFNHKCCESFDPRS
jgi:hypothetical protein